MAEYIEREAAYKDFEKCNSENPKWTPSRVKTLIARQKAADVAPVRHGRWDENGRCTVCGRDAPFWSMASTYYESPYCFECGAKMDGGDGNGDICSKTI